MDEIWEGEVEIGITEDTIYFDSEELAEWWKQHIGVEEWDAKVTFTETEEGLYITIPKPKKEE